MNLLANDDACPNCTQPDIPADSSDLTGAATYNCPRCGHTWTTGWNTEPREDARIREARLLDPGRFEEPSGEGRYEYDDEPDQ
jgi:predicted RNA-binding Zn-ribbon protein involved in translation (DUF1610 family)